MLQSLILAAGEAAEHEEHNPIVPLWEEVGIALVVFAILFFAVKKFVVPNFEKTFAERTSAIEGGLQAGGATAIGGSCSSPATTR